MSEGTRKALFYLAVLGFFLSLIWFIILGFKAISSRDKVAMIMTGWPVAAAFFSLMAMRFLKRPRLRSPVLSSQGADAEKRFVEKLEEAEREKKDTEKTSPLPPPRKPGFFKTLAATNIIWIFLLIIFGLILSAIGIALPNRILVVLGGGGISFLLYLAAYMIEKNPEAYRGLLSRFGVELDKNANGKLKKKLRRLRYVPSAVAVVFAGLALTPKALLTGWFLVCYVAFSVWLLSHAMRVRSNVWPFVRKALFVLLIAILAFLAVASAIEEFLPGFFDYIMDKGKQVYPKQNPKTEEKKETVQLFTERNHEKVLPSAQFPTSQPAPSQSQPVAIPPKDEELPPSCQSEDEAEEKTPHKRAPKNRGLGSKSPVIDEDDSVEKHLQEVEKNLEEMEDRPVETNPSSAKIKIPSQQGFEKILSKIPSVIKLR